MTNTRIGHMLAAAREQTTPERLRSLPDRLVGWRPLPPLLLLAALSTVFIFANDRGNFYRPGSHDYVTADHLGIAKNLSPQHNFLMFRFQQFHNGEIVYHPYNRFPIGTHALVKLVIFPFQHGSSSELYISRILMLLFFSGSAILAYLSLDRLIANRWIALAATMLAFSSTYALYYNDMVAPDGIPSVFGILFTLHGLIVFSQEKKMRQLLFKIAVSILLGWPVLVFISLFFVFGIAKSVIEEVRKRNEKINPGRIFKNDYAKIGTFSILFSLVIFGFNIINESLSVNTSPLNIPSISSLRERSGIDQFEWRASDEEDLNLSGMVSTFLYRISTASIPASLPNYSSTTTWALNVPWNSQGSIVGMIIISFSIAAALFAKEKIILVPLVLSGLIWVLVFRYHTIVHDFTTLFFIGIPLIFFSTLLQFFTKNSGRMPPAFLATGTVFLFVFSVVQMENVGYNSNSATDAGQIRKDFLKIREITKNHSVFINLPEDNEYYPATVPWYYLSGSFIANITQRYQADYFISESRVSCGLVTQENLHVFLYDSFESFADCELEILEGSPVFRDAILTPYQVYFREKMIRYAHEGHCGQHAASSEIFFLHVFPVRIDDLPAGSREYGFANLDFLPAERWQDIDGHCVIGAQLPAYDIASIRTGQYTEQETLWSAEIRVAEE